MRHFNPNFLPTGAFILLFFISNRLRLISMKTISLFCAAVAATAFSVQGGRSLFFTPGKKLT